LPLTMLIRKARCYSQAVSLSAHQLLESDEKSLWFNHVGLSKQELEQLEKTNLQHFHIKID
uniref:hypothetical protein n=1 Tax=Pseudomonas aeruginosa TaxID=287 RepID=UPI0019D435F0